MDTKELILETTLKLMIEKENSLMSIRQISTASGIATGGIYQHFSNKVEIYN
ncbi:MAG: helix-turn-helix transcriptional regulator [Methanobrevibacter sp.]|nr:helix-turn-helix transcriptional regulator [Methanobrevibacter sp.]